jgi:hypothetical protein
MKIFLINVTGIYFLFVFCQNSKEGKSEQLIGNKICIIKDIVVGTNTTKVLSQNTLSDSNVTNQKKQKHKKAVKAKAIIHRAPEQGKIDSIKNAKTKEKIRLKT